MARYLVEAQEEFDSILLVQTLFLLLPSKFLSSRPVEEVQNAVFDLAAIFSDDLPKSRMKEMGLWIIDNAGLLTSNPEQSVRIQSLVPFPENTTIFDEMSIKLENKTEPVEKYKKNWEIIERGLCGPEPDLSMWDAPTSINQLNDTAISLSHFGAKRSRPKPPTFESLYSYGWRPNMGLAEGIVEHRKENVYNLDDEFIQNRLKRILTIVPIKPTDLDEIGEKEDEEMLTEVSPTFSSKARSNKRSSDSVQGGKRRRK